MTLFKYIEDKDVFKKYYHQRLCHRLLSGNYDVVSERSMVSKLREEGGNALTGQFDRLVNDVVVQSRETMDLYKKVFSFS